MQHAVDPVIQDATLQQPSTDSGPAENPRVRRGADAKSGSWNTQDARGGPEGEDYLYELGRSDVSMNVDTGAIRTRHVTVLFNCLHDAPVINGRHELTALRSGM